MTMPGKRWRRKFGGNPNELYLCSRSSGSQLAGCVIVTEWEKIGLPRNAQCGEIANEFLPKPIGSPLVRVLFTKGMIARGFSGRPDGYRIGHALPNGSGGLTARKSCSSLPKCSPPLAQTGRSPPGEYRKHFNPSGTTNRSLPSAALIIAASWPRSRAGLAKSPWGVQNRVSTKKARPVGSG